jgi:hypothetical protein
MLAYTSSSDWICFIECPDSVLRRFDLMIAYVSRYFLVCLYGLPNPRDFSKFRVETLRSAQYHTGENISTVAGGYSTKKHNFDTISNMRCPARCIAKSLDTMLSLLDSTVKSLFQAVPISVGKLCYLVRLWSKGNYLGEGNSSSMIIFVHWPSASK